MDGSAAERPGEMSKERSTPTAAGAPKTRRAVSRAAGSELDQLRAEREAMRRALDDARARIAQLERLADEDSLAPITNRRALVRKLSRMIGFTRRYGPPASVIYFDVDDLKPINDTHGHPAGDAALRHIAEILSKNVRESDIVGRLGGDEFGVILAQTNPEQANAWHWRKPGSTPLRWGKFEIPISAAYGVYSFTGSDDAQVAIEAADQQMHKQKRV